MGNGKMRVIRALCLIIMLACLFRLGQAYCLSVEHQRKQEELKKLTDTDTAQADMEKENTALLQEDDRNADEKEAGSAQQERTETQTDDRNAQKADTSHKASREVRTTGGSGISGEEDGHPVLNRYRALHLENGDLAGWLSIEGMQIDYPVMQCEDDEYYLHHDFDGSESKYGCLYVRERADLEEGTNFVIYGHNMKDGSMFGDLDFYKEEAFCREHSRIAFDTLYAEYEYEVVAVFLSQIYEENDDVFKYYQFYEAETEEEFEDFYQNIKKLSLYDTGVSAEFGDQFLTLSTCAYHVKDGRLAVVAKRVT